jgi:spore germination cell wall hydrolase CwlJ-like protein
MNGPETLSEREVIARTLWAEARGEADDRATPGHDGMTAVACVIANRMRKPRWWGGPGARSVCLKPWQFSCWNPGDPNRAKLLAVSERDPLLAEALRIADGLLSGTLADVTQGADHYCTRAVAAATAWTRGRKPTVTIGNHLFFQLET